MLTTPNSGFYRRTVFRDECLEWIGQRLPNGYGRLYVSHRGAVYAHRYSYELAYGPFPQHMFVLHRCDNPPCVRPEHLFLGTPQENMADRDAKGRTAKGERSGARLHPERMARGTRHPQAKLNDEAVRVIRRLRSHGVTAKDLATQFNCSPNLVWRVLSGERWGHVTEPTSSVERPS